MNTIETIGNAVKLFSPEKMSTFRAWFIDFDYSQAVSGKYYPRILKENFKVVVLEQGTAKAFPSSSAVNGCAVPYANQLQ